MSEMSFTEAPEVEGGLSSRIRAQGRRELSRSPLSSRLEAAERWLVAAASVLTLLWAAHAVTLTG